MDPDAMYLTNDPDGDADCLAALQQVEQAAAMNEPHSMYFSDGPDGDADCLAALQQVEQAAVMNDPYSTYFSDGPEGDADCVAALDAAEQEQLAYPLEFQLVPHVDRRVRKFGLHRRVFTTRLV